jgi:hypothetical protein
MIKLINRFILVSVFALMPCHAAFAGSFVINQVAGFTDTTAVSPVGGNPGTTIGAQRANVVAYAAGVWTGIVQPSVNMTIDVQFSALFCNLAGATLGSTNPSGKTMNFSGAAYANTWYPRALANHLSAAVVNPVMSANFNSQLEGNAGCLSGARWYYGYDHNPGVNQFDLLEIVLHEMAHGLGFTTFVDLASGTKSGGYDDIYMKFLRDNSLNKNWPVMSDAERAASAKDNGDLLWSGAHVQHLISTLIFGTRNNYPRLYAPTTLAVGSSVTHWDSNVTYLGNKNELLEYQHSISFDMALTVAAMRDLGWSAALYDFDGDGTSDENDDFPQSNAADADTDGDGMVDTWLAGSGCSGPSCAGFTLDGDDDGDGVPDAVDASPLNATIKNEIELPLNSTYKGSSYSSNSRHP